MTKALYAPMLAKASSAGSGRRTTELTTLARQDGWIGQEKVDGIRAVLYGGGTTTRIFNRNGVEITAAFPEVASLRLPAVVIDGELVARDGLFQTVATRDKQRGRVRYGSKAVEQREYRALARANPCYFIAFDLLELPGGFSLLQMRLDERLPLLRKIIGNRRNIRPIRQSKDLRALWAEVTAAGGEGIVAKRASSIYLPGQRAESWVKFKHTQAITCVAVGYERGERRELGAIHLALIDPAGKPVRIGKVGTGWTEAAGEDYLARFKAGTIFMVEVEVLNRTATELRFAVLRGERTDVPLSAAALSQLDTIPFY